MDYTSQPEEAKIIRSKKMMLWFGIISLSMMFAGLSSAYIVSSERKDWLTDFKLPSAFYISTAVIVLSSLTLIFAKKMILQNRSGLGKILLTITFILGIGFIYLQFLGFDQILDQGYFFTGSESNTTTSLIYIFVVAHLVHIISGLIVLLVVMVNQFRGRYDGEETLGLSLGATFWHFCDVLWIYLFLFLTFYK